MSANNDFYFYSILTKNDFIKIINCKVDNEKYDIVLQKMLQTYFISNSILYCYDSALLVYKQYCDLKLDKRLGHIINSFIQASFSALDKIDPQFVEDALTGEFKAVFIKMCEGKFVKNISFFLAQLEGRNITFDDDKHGIHFRNARYDLCTNQLVFITERDHPLCRNPSMYISKYIDYDYSYTSTADVLGFDDDMRKIFLDSWEYMKYYVSKSLCGESVKDCEFIVHKGPAGAGKSTLFHILSSVLGEGVYVTPIKFSAFDDNNEFQMSVRDMPSNIRFILVEEIEKIKTISNLKMLVDGVIPMRSKFKHITRNIDIKAKLFMTSNYYIDFQNDPGVERRLFYLEYKSKFCDPGQQPDPANLIFERSEHFTPASIKNWNSHLKSIAFTSLAMHSRMYYSGQSIQRPFAYRSCGDVPSIKNFVTDGLVHAPGIGVQVESLVRMCQSTMADYAVKPSDKDVIAKFRGYGILETKIKKQKIFANVAYSQKLINYFPTQVEPLVSMADPFARKTRTGANQGNEESLVGVSNIFNGMDIDDEL